MLQSSVVTGRLAPYRFYLNPKVRGIGPPKTENRTPNTENRKPPAHAPEWTAPSPGHLPQPQSPLCLDPSIPCVPCLPWFKNAITLQPQPAPSCIRRPSLKRHCASILQFRALPRLPRLKPRPAKTPLQACRAVLQKSGVRSPDSGRRTPGRDDKKRSRPVRPFSDTSHSRWPPLPYDGQF
ncbi:MAG: hypothetical protein RL215_53 [Planctomycetota bacterium]